MGEHFRGWPRRPPVRLVLAAAVAVLLTVTLAPTATAQEAPPTCTVAGPTPLAGVAGCEPPTTTTTTPPNDSSAAPSGSPQSDEVPPPVDEVAAAPSAEAAAPADSTEAPGAVFSPGLGAGASVQVFDAPAGSSGQQAARVSGAGPSLAVSPGPDDDRGPSGGRVGVAFVVLLGGLGYLALRGASEIEARRAAAEGGIGS